MYHVYANVTQCRWVANQHKSAIGNTRNEKTPDSVASWEQEGETLFNSYWKKIVATAVMHLCPGGVVMRGGLK